MATTIVEAAPLGCTTPTDSAKALGELRSQYIVADLKAPSMKYLRIEAGLRNSMGYSYCKYNFVETKKNPEQFPPTLLTAECDKSVFGFCDPRCRPVTYEVTVLRREKNCNSVLGEKVWTAKQVNVVVGYKMYF